MRKKNNDWKINQKLCAELIKRIFFHQMKRIYYVYLLTGHPPGNVLDVRSNKPNMMFTTVVSFNTCEYA